MWFSSKIMGTRGGDQQKAPRSPQWSSIGATKEKTPTPQPGHVKLSEIITLIQLLLFIHKQTQTGKSDAELFLPDILEDFFFFEMKISWFGA